MTQLSALSNLRAPRIGVLRGLLNPTTVLALGLTAALSLGAWMFHERAVTPPDFRGAIAGLAFAPYHAGESGETGGRQPTTAEIASDIKIVAGQTQRISTYTVAGPFAEIPRLAAGSGLKVTLGGWLDTNAVGNAVEINRLIATANSNSNVERVIVGNETQLRGDISLARLIADIRKVKAAVHVPVTTAEDASVWLRRPALAASVDVINLHLLPYWNGVSVDKSLNYIMAELDAVHRAYPSKPIMIGEVGWPSNGVTEGAAVASRDNQALFMRKFFVEAQRRHLDYFVMEAFDQPWKTAFEGRAAGYWGMMDLSRHAKWSLTGSVIEDPRWALFAGISIVLAALFSGLLLSRRPDITFGGKLMFAGLTQGFTAVLALGLLAMSGDYLSGVAMAIWGALAAGQALLIFLLIADSFEMAEALFGRVWHRIPSASPAPLGAEMPKVSVHIAICNEPPEMVKLTLNALADLDYPDYEVLVVDNNTKDPALWEPVAEHCARLGARFRFFHLGKWPGFKAGALNFAMRETAADAEVIGVLDSDYVVRHDWLRSMAPHFNNPAVGFVQSPQDYRDNDGSFFKRLMFWEYAGFFQNGMVTRNERNAVIQHGTMTLVRKSALEGVNCWAEWTICEDSELGMKLFRQGWEGGYSAKSFGKGVMPDDFAAFRKQRFRWAYGAMQICRGHWKALLSPWNRDLTLGQRWHFVTGWLPWMGDALGLAFLGMGLAWSVGLIVAPVRFEFPIALFMLPSIGLFVFKLVQIFSLYAKRVPCGWTDRLGAAVAGLALSHTIGKAVWKGLLIRSAPFLRTPKMENAPALVQGLVMAREELMILVATWAALIGVAVTSHLATLEARLWCTVLFTQALPYVASVFVAVMAALPAPVRVMVTSKVTEKAGMFAAGD